MATSDFDALLEPVAPDDPVGPNLEYDADFLAAFQAAEGTPERRMGDTVVAAEEPDWRQAQQLALGLMVRTKDLRIAVLLTRALLRLSGIAGLAQGLALVQGLIGRYWEQVHPQLDPNDDNDPISRINVLMDLCSRETLLDSLRTTALIRSRAFGPLSYRDIEVADGRASAPANTKPLEAAAVSGAFRDCDLDELAEVTSAAARALAAVRALIDSLATQVPSGVAPDFEPLVKALSPIAELLAARLAERQPGDGVPTGGSRAEGERTRNAAQAVGVGSAEIASREDVVRALDRICDYYSRNEPSSPVPLLLKRARRLATGSFLDIVRDLAPDSLAQIEKVCGTEQKS